MTISTYSIDMEEHSTPWDGAAGLEGLGHCENWNGNEDPWPPDDLKVDMVEATVLAHDDDMVNYYKLQNDRSSPASINSTMSDAKMTLYPELVAPLDAASASACETNGPYFALPATHPPSSQGSDQTIDTMAMTGTTSKRTDTQVLQCDGGHFHTNELHLQGAASTLQIFDPLTIGNVNITEKSPDDNVTRFNQTDKALYSHGADLDQQYLSKYELRPQGRIANSNFTSTWIDQDDTGNYDPNEEERQLRAKRNQVRLKRRVDSVAGPSSEGGNDEDAESTSREPRNLVSKLPFTTASGRLARYSILNKPPARHETEIDHFSTGYRLRSKATSTAEPKQSRNAEHGLPEDLTGHPVARGCWACLEPGKDDCSLLEYEHTYPCHGCLESGSECELIIPPITKRVCESCKRRRRTCSYTYSDYHNEPCLDCADDGFHCVAGPTKDAIRSRIRYDAPPIIKKAAPAKVYWTCQQCQDAGRNCSFTSNGQSVPDCTACEMGGAICVPKQSDTKPQPGKQEMARKVEEGRRKRARSSDGDEADQHLSKVAKQRPNEPLPDNSDISKPELLPQVDRNTLQQQPTSGKKVSTDTERLKSSGGKTTTITTRFSHPILLNNTTPAANGICDFCDGSSFALLGLEPKVVEVIDWQDGRGLTEVSGGHMGEGTPSTRMCIVCTMHRCNIITCQDYSLRKLPNADKLLQRAGAALGGLFNGVVQEKDRWCSLCPSLASYECETGTVDSHGRPCLGCGLLLCETCMIYLGVADGDLQKMLASMCDEPSDERPLGVRADLELLKADGSLVRHMMWLSEQEEA
ncbi:hypothetical protein LTR86_007234 [Recurvomyces mirabilis]|nr:hypothetical protein LTR86_007234 [Recurvomyces mirabilis]